MSDEIMNHNSVPEILESNEIHVSPTSIEGMDLSAAMTFLDLMHLPEDEVEARMEEQQSLINRLRTGEVHGQPAVELALHFDALHHIGAMMHVSFLTEDPELMRLSGIVEKLQTATDFHFTSARHALEGFISQDSEKMKAYLDGQIIHLEEEINRENLPILALEEAQQEKSRYELLRSQLS